MDLDLFLKVIHGSMERIHADVMDLYKTKGNSVVLDHLYQETIRLDGCINYFAMLHQIRIHELPDQNQVLPAQQTKPGAGMQTFTLQSLAEFNGKKGKPAYVAVNGVVYDVTNNAAWAAATHFGQSAGKDLTQAFASCHAGAPVLSKLPIVGALV